MAVGEGQQEAMEAIAECLKPVLRFDSRQQLVTRHVPAQEARLRDEGVAVSPRGTVADAALWTPTHAELYLRAPAPDVSG